MRPSLRNLLGLWPCCPFDVRIKRWAWKNFLFSPASYSQQQVMPFLPPQIAAAVLKPTKSAETTYSLYLLLRYCGIPSNSEGEQRKFSSCFFFSFCLQQPAVIYLGKVLGSMRRCQAFRMRALMSYPQTRIIHK